ncbi:MAG: hypothetical protein OJF50_006632 [Nitrospira sp.]|nr:hypothetical protein [Nitrospira sp.]
MGLGELYVTLLLLKGMTLQQTQLLKICAMSEDPPACYDAIPSRLDLQDALAYGWGSQPVCTPGQFYHYQDPQPLPHRPAPGSSAPSVPSQTCQ